MCYGLLFLHRVLLSLESIAAQYAQILQVNETIIVREEDFILLAENVTKLKYTQPLLCKFE